MKVLKNIFFGSLFAGTLILSMIGSCFLNPSKAHANHSTADTSFLTSPNLNNQKFTGWWRLDTIGSQSGFNPGGPFTAFQDQYIYIDASVYPVQITTTFGTDKYPRLLPDALDPTPFSVPSIDGVPTANSFYYYGNPNELVNGYNVPLKGPITNNVATWNFAPTLKLIDDKTISSFAYLNYNYFGSIFAGSLAIYKKMDTPPVDTSGLDWNDPVNLFKYYISSHTFSNVSTNKKCGGTNYVGKNKEHKITQKFLNGTFTKTTPLRKIRVTNKLNYAAIGISNDTWTTIYTGNPAKNTGKFSYATPGSTVTITGATGALSILNGTYPNGVGVLNAGANLGMKPEFVDNGPNGSFNDLFNSFLLNLDTSTLKDLADPQTGWMTLPSGINMTVNHSISSSSTYNEFCASSAAWFYSVLQTGTHPAWFLYTYPDSCRVIDTFANLQTMLANDTVNSNFSNYIHRGQPMVNWFYHNFYDTHSKTYQNMVNCPYPINYNNPLFEYDVVLGNYLINPQNLVFTIRGVLESDQPDPNDTYGYPFIEDPSAGRAHFEGLVIPANVVDGVIQPNIPENYASLGDFGNDFDNLNGYYFGQINPELTGGKVIGYLLKKRSEFLDPFAVMFSDGIYTQENPNTSTNPRIFREGTSAVYSKMMQWFNSIECEALIIDQAGNQGGLPEFFNLVEFMGTDRQADYAYSAYKKSRKGLSNYLSSKIGKAGKKYDGTSDFLYVSLNEKLYPGSVFKGDKKQEKKVVLITDVLGWSSADIAPNILMLNKKGNLGHNTRGSIIGCVDGREFMSENSSSDFPVNVNPISASKNLVDSSNTPVSPFTFNIDFGYFFQKYSNKKLSPLVQNKEIRPASAFVKGTSGSNALPISYEQTLFPDFGYTPMNRAFIPGWTTLHPSPPTPADPTTWTYLYLDAAIMHVLE